jgi:type III restriction enzyme
MKLKDYQKTAVDKLLSHSKKLLEKDGSRVCVFKSPTGSGKTIIVADFLQQLASEQLSKRYSFIWISGNNLHTQSKEKLEKYLEASRYTLSYLDEIQNTEFKENEIVFVNWHSLTKKDRKTGEWSNIFMRENEQDRNLPTFVKNTKDEGREIVLIVDESHYHYWSKQSQELIQDVIGPKLTLEVSATPSITPSPEEIVNNDAGYVSVKFEDVVAEGMIKSEVVINKEIGEGINADLSADEAVLDASVLKQKQLKKLYEEEKSDVNPLVLIQLPSESQSTSALDESKLEFVQKYLEEKHDISLDNGKLAIWLSDTKENLDLIENTNSKVEVLVFKQAIALGWDCPRAQVLVMFRDIGSVTFEIQTVGRILRMPEIRHYDSQDLNQAYVYTNLESITIRQDDDTSLTYFKVHPVHRIDSYTEINLPSVYLSRVDYGDLTLSFRKLLIEEANKRFKITQKDSAKEGYRKADVDLELYPEELTKAIIADAVIPNLDEAKDITGSSVEFSVQADDIKYKFEKFAKLMSLPFAPVRSHTKIQQAFYDWFDQYLGYEDKSRIEIQRVVVCSSVNQKIFAEIIERAKERFRDVRIKEQNAKQKKKEYIWDVPVVDYYNENSEAVNTSNYALETCYLDKKRSKPEIAFEEMLNESNNIEWWYKNGVSKETYFAIPYTDKDGFERAFYPDFILKKKDGSVGIIDTKSGFTAESEDARLKSNALQEYIFKHKKLKLFGGLMIPEKTGLKMFVGKDYTSDSKDTDWIEIDSI